LEALEREVARAKRYETDLVLSMMDLDHFKHINHQYGNPAGDMVLSEIGKMLKEYIYMKETGNLKLDKKAFYLLNLTSHE